MKDWLILGLWQEIKRSLGHLAVLGSQEAIRLMSQVRKTQELTGKILVKE